MGVHSSTTTTLRQQQAASAERHYYHSSFIDDEKAYQILEILNVLLTPNANRTYRYPTANPTT